MGLMDDYIRQLLLQQDPEADIGQPPEYPDVPYEEPAAPSYLDRLSLALQNVPQYTERPGESGGSAFARGLIGGAARGFAGAGVQRMTQQEQERQRRNAQAERRAAAQYTTAMRSHERRVARKEQKDLLMSPRWQAPEAPEKPLERIEVEAEARARGARKGAPLVSSKNADAGGLFGTAPTENDADTIAQAIADGLQPPDLKGLYRFGGPVRASLARRGYDYTKANLDWQGAQRWTATANGSQQLRLRQAAQTAYESLDVVDDLNNRLSKLVPRSSVRVFNRAALVSAMNGAFGQEAQNVATQLNAQITDIVSELANVYMGGNSPTEEALHLAEKNLRSDWSLSQLRSATDLARKNLRIRINSVAQSGPITQGGGMTLAPGGPDASGRVKVVGPKGETGTVPKGSQLPRGWKVVE